MKYLLLFLCILLFDISLAQEHKPILRVGLCADVQYCDCPDRGRRLYSSSLTRLDSIVSFFNEEKVDLSIHLGDIIDQNIAESFPPTIKVFKRLNKKILHLLGNHDVSHLYKEGYGGLRGNLALQKFIQALEMPNTYYSVKEKNVVFIILDSNDMASYSISPDNEQEKTAEYEALKDMVNKREQNNGQGGLEYNGGLSQKQLLWLKETLDKAQNNGDIALIFTHQAPYPENGFQILNNWEVLDLIEKYDNVKLCVAGHHHPGAFAYYKNIPMLTLEGVVEGMAFAILNIYDDKLIIEGLGKTKSRVFTN